MVRVSYQQWGGRPQPAPWQQGYPPGGFGQAKEAPMLPEEHRSRSNSRANGQSPYSPPTPQMTQAAQATAYQQQLMQQQQ